MKKRQVALAKCLPCAVHNQLPLKEVVDPILKTYHEATKTLDQEEKKGLLSQAAYDTRYEKIQDALSEALNAENISYQYYGDRMDWTNGKFEIYQYTEWQSIFVRELK